MPLPAEMTVIEMNGFGPAEVMREAKRPVPKPVAGEVLIKVAAAGINRVDVLQRSGAYRPPYGVWDVPGVELAGEIVAMGPGTGRFKVGDQVCALVIGGAYAEYCTVPEAQVLRLPKGYDMVRAACLPETLFTVWAGVMWQGRYKGGESLLVHGGSSGIGTTTIQLARALGNGIIYATAGNDAKCRAVEKLGVKRCINYKTEDFVAVVNELAGERAIDVILDMVIGPYVPRNQSLLADDGRLVFIGLMSGQREVTINGSWVMMRRHTISGVSLRGQSIERKDALRRDMEPVVWPLLDKGEMPPIIDTVYPLRDAVKAHKFLETSEHIGKLVLTL